MGKKVIAGLMIASGALLILALLNFNRLVQRNKTYLLAEAEQSLGLKISPERIEVTLWPISARLIDVTVSGDRALSTEDLLRAKAIAVELKFLPLLTGRLRARRVALDSPVLTIVRDDSGRDNASGSRKSARKPSVSNTPTTTEKQDTAPFFIIAPLKISNGTLRYRDQRTGRELTVTQIHLEVDGAEPDEPFQVELEAAVMAAKTNVRLKGSFGPMAAVLDYRDVPMDGNMQVDALDMGKINNALPRFKKALPRVLQFDGIYSTKELKFKGSLNHLSLKGAVTGTDASVRFE